MSNPYLIKENNPTLSLSFYTKKVACKQYNLANTPRTGQAKLPPKKEINQLVQKFNQALPQSAKPVIPSDLLRLDFLDATFTHLCFLYEEKINPQSFERAYASLDSELGKDKLIKIEDKFKEAFPLLGNGKNNIKISQKLRDWVLLSLKTDNPASEPFHDLFRDEDLEQETHFNSIPLFLSEFFRSEPPLLAKEGSFLEMLAKPVSLFPISLKDQVDYILKHWRSLLNQELLSRLCQIEETTREEDIYFSRLNTEKGEFDPTYRLSLLGDGSDYSQDSSWMPTVVMIAKSTLVWLSQLSRTYNRPIRGLGDIPNEELDRLKDAGFTALWLIGIWTRSSASQRIKQIMGNPEAQASAYSLKEYEIAESLGGWAGLENLKTRASERGIRIASDMVPNHTGIDSRWIYERPDYFLQLDHSPYESYSFNGENLSNDPKISLKIEDGYYNQSDAGVVFEHQNLETGQTRYIYHGNDGTSVPWNDTAQLDFALADVRDAVMEEILKIARTFPIIRFDAAMTLAKKHIQRLWHPLPNEGNTISSRERQSLSNEEFDRLMPREFWREVVERVAQEVPDTLLLAEAFWMLEGYFVRTLGMHRVYNSAFMNMLKMERNAEYRSLMKEVLATDPEILRRFVNFMNNPDEDTALAQFGGDDKYFGVCTLMATLPGLPMFGHGQIEGFSEKYGMEYARDYYQENPNEYMVSRHQQEIFPLLLERKLFSDVDSFVLYDFQTDYGVNENVFTYSNFSGNVASLILYNNTWQETYGRLALSPVLKDSMPFKNEGNSFVFLFDKVSERWFMQRSRDFNEGLQVHLNGYGKRVFLYLHERQDSVQGELENLFRQFHESGFSGSIEDQLSLFRGEHSVLRSWGKLYETNYLENWTNYNLEGEVLRGALKERVNSFFSLYAGNSLNQSQKNEINQTVDGFWLRVQYLNRTLGDLGEPTPLEDWLSPAGVVFVYDQLYKSLSPWLDSFSENEINSNFLESEKSKALSRFWSLSVPFLETIPILSGEDIHFPRDWEKILQTKAVPFFLAQDKGEFPVGTSPRKVLISTKAWLDVLESFEKDEKTRRKDKIRLQNFLSRNLEPN